MITLLCGGFGGARFARGFADAGLDVTLVVNTADDLTFADVLISPDVDLCLHALAGVLDEEQGWGIVGDRYRTSSWFRVGEQDLAFAQRRTALLQSGMTLTRATAALAAERGIAATVLPMSDAEVRTFVDTPIGRLPLQEFLVRHRGRPRVDAVHQLGGEQARPTSEVLHAIREAELVVIGPSSPVASVLPILDLEGVRDELHGRVGPTVAVSPVVRSVAPSRPPEAFRYDIRERFLAARGVAHTAEDIAGLYSGLIDGFVGDTRDGVEGRGLTDRSGAPLAIALADTLAGPGHHRAELALEVVAFGTLIGDHRRSNSSQSSSGTVA